MFKSYNYTLRREGTQGSHMREGVSLEQCYTDTLSGFADYKPDRPVLFAILCGFDLCDESLCTMYKEAFACGATEHVKFTPKTELSKSSPQLLPDGDTVEAFACYSEKLGQVDKEQEIMFKDGRAIGCFKEYCLSGISDLNGVIRFQVILPLLCKFGLPEIAFDVFSKVSAALGALGKETSALDLLDISWSISRQKIYDNGRKFPQRFRFVLRLPFTMYPAVEDAFINARLPLVDRIISLRPDTPSREIIKLVADGALRDNTEVLVKIKNEFERGGATYAEEPLYKEMLNVLNQIKILFDNPEFDRQHKL